MEDKPEKNRIDLDRILAYLLIAATLLAGILYIADMKERIRALEVKWECWEK